MNGKWLCVLLMLCGCSGGGGEKSVPASGDPEADRRADVRVAEDKGGNSNKPTATLYERLGGQSKIEQIVDDMTERVIADPRVNFARTDIKSSWVSHYKPWEATPENIARFKKRMVEFLTLAAGGPTEYSGREMRTVHKGMKITNAEFDAMVGDIKTSMDRVGLGAREKRDLLAVVETTRKSIVEK